jgi:hypothetical protein
MFVCAGQACRRFGGNIPLIGFSPWGVVFNHNELIVPDNTVNYGYIARQPIKYSFDAIPETTSASHLEENHSHFILVSFKCSS